MIATAVQLLVLMGMFSFLESRWPAVRAHRWWRRPFLVDLCIWLIHPLAMAAGITLAIASTNAIVAELPKAGLSLAFLQLHDRVAAFSPWAQIGMAIVIADFLSYWIHRAYHRFPVLWAFHVVHHSSEELDWLSTSRLHPVSQTLNTAAMGVVLLLTGLSVTAVVTANVFIGGAALLVHANVRWTFGPFQHLLVSPLFHQWHHARVDDAHRERIGNFGAVFSIWDRLFGTWSRHIPDRPVRFGVENAPAPTLLGLVLHPLRVGIRFFSGVQRRHRSLAITGGARNHAAEQGIAREEATRKL